MLTPATEPPVQVDDSETESETEPESEPESNRPGLGSHAHTVRSLHPCFIPFGSWFLMLDNRLYLHGRFHWHLWDQSFIKAEK